MTPKTTKSQPFHLTRAGKGTRQHSRHMFTPLQLRHPWRPSAASEMLGPRLALPPLDVQPARCQREKEEGGERAEGYACEFGDGEAAVVFGGAGRRNCGFAGWGDGSVHCPSALQ